MNHLQLVEALRAEQRRRWQAGERPVAESFLNQHPTLKLDLDCALELVYHEVLLREQQGESPRLDEYLARFPSLQEQLTSLFEVHGAIESEHLWQSAQPMMPAPTPTRIGRYTVRRSLGEGAFGTVYLAHDTELDRPVAIKIPRTSALKSALPLADLLREARRAASLRHPNIVTIHDLGQADGYCYIISEYIDGSNLAERMLQARPTFRESALLVAQVAEALHAAHRLGLVHRDIKPSNILVDRNGQAHVADFGLAIMNGESPGDSAWCAGTPQYMSPEQVQPGADRVDARSDLYSLGVVLYELLSAKRPFAANSLEELFAQIRQADLTLPHVWEPRVPAELERICLKAMARHPSERYASAADLAQELREWQANAEGLPRAVHDFDVRPDDAVTLIPQARSTQIRLPEPGAAQEPPATWPLGLCAFDASRSEAYQELWQAALAPGSVMPWQELLDWIGTDGQGAARMGVLRGAPGSGKTSLVRAGLLARLPDRWTSVELSGDPRSDDAKLRQAIHDLVASCENSTPHASNNRLLVVVDDIDFSPDPTPAARLLETWFAQVDERLGADARRCVHWLLVSRTPIVPATPRLPRLADDATWRVFSAPVISEDEARRLLHRLGAGYRCLPGEVADCTPAQCALLDQAARLVVGDQGASLLMLKLLVEVIKGRPWNVATLAGRDTHAVFLKECLDDAFQYESSVLEPRLQKRAARILLGNLLAQHDAATVFQPRESLRRDSPFRDRTVDFTKLIRVLTTELGLLETNDAGDPRLAHASLRQEVLDWVNAEESRPVAKPPMDSDSAARAPLPPSSSLPTWLEWANTLLGRRAQRWQPRMDQPAPARMGQPVLLGIAILACLLFVGWIGARGLVQPRGNPSGTARHDAAEDGPLPNPPLGEAAPAPDSLVEQVAGDLSAAADREWTSQRERLHADGLVLDPRERERAIQDLASLGGNALAVERFRAALAEHDFAAAERIGARIWSEDQRRPLLSQIELSHHLDQLRQGLGSKSSWPLLPKHLERAQQVLANLAANPVQDELLGGTLTGLVRALAAIHDPPRASPELLPWPTRGLILVLTRRVELNQTFLAGDNLLLLGAAEESPVVLLNSSPEEALGLPFPAGMPLPDVALTGRERSVATLLNPAETGTAIDFVIAKRAYHLLPGNAEAIDVTRPTRITIQGSGTQVARDLPLSAGEYRFLASADGWQMAPAEYTVTLNNAANPFEFHYLVDGQQESISAHGSRVHAANHPLAVTFDRGRPQRLGTKLLESGTYSIGVLPNEHEWDLFTQP